MITVFWDRVSVLHVACTWGPGVAYPWCGDACTREPILAQGFAGKEDRSGGKEPPKPFIRLRAGKHLLCAACAEKLECVP